MIRWLKALWCDLTHGGGHIVRDEQGLINWRCSKCGRWSGDPVSVEDEDHLFDRENRHV